MKMDTLNKTFDPHTLADDLLEVRRIYAHFFAGLAEADWDKPVKGGSKEWTLHETVAHLCALNGAGLESVEHTLRGETYTFIGLDNRYEFNAYNRQGIDEHLDLPMKELCAKLLDILDEAVHIARNMLPNQAELAAQMPIYNRPVKVVEVLSIIFIHFGLFHSAQVAEPAGQPPLWMQLSPEIRHRAIGRVMLALSLLYRFDLAGDLQESFAFSIGGPGGGNWHVDVSPESASASEGLVEHPGLSFQMRKTDIFCQMFTGRLNIPLALLTRQLKLHGNLRLFPRFSSLFSENARPPGAANTKISSTPQHMTGGQFK